VSDEFSIAVDFVFQSLKARQQLGSSLKAESAALDSLIQIRPEPATIDAAIAPKVSVGSAVTPVVFAPQPTQPAQPAQSPRVSANVAPVVQFPALPFEEDDGGLHERLAALKVAVSGCVQCPNLVSTRAQVVFGEGNPQAELMFVGEAPGAEEEAEGRCFAGAEGVLFDKILLAMGLSRSKVFLTTALKCRPDSPAASVRARIPTPEELGRCLPYLAAQVALVKPKVIVALGAGAMRGLFGSTQTAAVLRSRWHNLQGIPVMPTFHLNYLILNSGMGEKRKVWEDLLQVMERLGQEISEKQRNFFLKSG
jgi:DNA polymerase